MVESGKQSKKANATLEEDRDESPLDDTEEGVQGGPSRKELEERMARAIMEAEDESGSEANEVFVGPGDNVELDGEDEGIGTGEGGSDDEDEDEDEDAPSTRPSGAPRKGDYLPGHLFKSAIVVDDNAPHPSAEASTVEAKEHEAHLKRRLALVRIYPPSLSDIHLMLAFSSRMIRTLP